MSDMNAQESNHSIDIRLQRIRSWWHRHKKRVLCSYGPDPCLYINHMVGIRVLANDLGAESFRAFGNRPGCH